MKAIWNDVVIAESDDTVVVEGNHYFPAATLKREYLLPSDTQTTCHWKGVACYYSLQVDGNVNKDAVWYYPDPKPAAAQIKNRVAFWKGVQVQALSRAAVGTRQATFARTDQTNAESPAGPGSLHTLHADGAARPDGRTC